MLPFELYPVEVWRKKCTRLYYLCVAVLSRSFEDKFRNFGVLQRHMCAFLEKPKDVSPQKFISVFRGSFKTTVLVGFMVWIFCWSLALGTPVAICYNTATKENAEAVSLDFQDIILNNKLLHWIFPELPAKESGYRKFSTWKIEFHHVKLHFTSLDTTKPSRHYDIIINDDLVNDKNSDSDVMRQSVIRSWRYQKSILTRYIKFGIGHEIDVGTLYHHKDLIAFIMGLPRYDKFIVPFKLGDMLVFQCNGDILTFPEMFTWEDFKRIKEEQGSDIFATQYELRCIDSQDRLLYPEWVTQWTGRSARSRITLVVDPGATENRKNCPSGITICSTDDDNIDVVLAEEVWLSPKRLLKHLIELKNLYRVDELYCEKEKYSLVFKDLVEILHPDLDIGLISHDNMPKEARRIKLKPLLEHRKIRFGPNSKLLAQRLMEEPDAEYHDTVDSMALQLKVAKPPDKKGGYHDWEDENPDDFETELRKAGVFKEEIPHQRSEDDLYF
jgi:hypothetical protein